ncbi:hypothetical protein ACFQ0M_13965 [Kitasatospora aburaviensis]
MRPAQVASTAGSTADPVGFVLSELSGWVVSGPVEFGGRLLHRGARTLRHGHTMYRDLAGDPPAAGWAAWAGTPLRNGLRAVPCDRPADDLLASCRAAYAPGPGPPPRPRGRSPRAAAPPDRTAAGRAGPAVQRPGGGRRRPGGGRRRADRLRRHPGSRTSSATRTSATRASAATCCAVPWPTRPPPAPPGSAWR